MAEKIRLAVNEWKAAGLSDNQILVGVVQALENLNLSNLFKEETNKDVSEIELRKEVTNIMRECGIPANVLGFNYLRDSIIISINEPATVNLITKKLYPEIAQIYGTTPSRAERAIRHAIELAWKRGDSEALNKYFGCKVGRPTNSEFIATISDLLSLKYELS